MDLHGPARRVGEFLPHDAAVQVEVQVDAVAGDGVAPPLAEGVEQGLARETGGLDCGQVLTVGARVAEVVVGAGDHTEAEALRQVVLPGMARPSPAFGVALVRMGRTVVLGAAPLGMNLEHGRHARVHTRRRDAAMAGPVRGVTGNQQASAAQGEVLKIFQIRDELVVALQIRKQHVVIALGGAVPFIGGHGDKFPRVVEAARMGDHLGPVRLRHVESVLPLRLDAPVVFAHVRPISMGSEGIEVQVVSGDLETARQRALRVPHLVVIVQVAEVVPVSRAGSGLRLLCPARRGGSR